MGVGIGEATLVMKSVLVCTDSVKQILLALEALLLVVCETFDLGHQKVFVGLACSIVDNLAATSTGCGGEGIERVLKLDTVGTSTRTVVFVRCVVTDD
jgi:hypothetical protein